MNAELASFIREHKDLTRRFFLRLGAVGASSLSALPLFSTDDGQDSALDRKIRDIESWLTLQDHFRDVSRGNPRPHSLDDAKRKEVGLTRDTWSLDVLSDPENKASLGRQLTKKDNTAFTFKHLMELAKTRAVRFP